MDKKKFTNRRGFTFVEMMVVIVLIGIVAGVVIISGLKSGADSAALTGQARELVSNIQMIRAKAIAENRRYKLKIKDTNNGYEIYYFDGGSFKGPETILLERNVTISGTVPEFAFEGNGGRSGSGDYSFTLTDTTGKVKSVKVTILGVAEIQ